MIRKVLRGFGVLMLLLAAGFVLLALNHPEMSFPWGNGVTYGIYGVYGLVTAGLLLVPVNN